MVGIFLFVHQSRSRRDFKSSHLKRHQTFFPSLVQSLNCVRKNKLLLEYLWAVVRDKLWETGREICLIWKYEFWLDHWLPNWGMSNWCFITTFFRVHTGVSCAWKALSKAGGFGNLCYKVKQEGMEHLWKSICQFKILKGEATGLSKVFFAIGKKNPCLKEFSSFSPKGWIWESKNISPSLCYETKMG